MSDQKSSRITIEGTVSPSIYNSLTYDDPHLLGCYLEGLAAGALYLDDGITVNMAEACMIEVARHG